MPIDFGDRVGRGAKCVEIVDAVHDADDIDKTSDEANAHLTGNSNRHIALRVGYFFGKMASSMSANILGVVKLYTRRSVRRAHRVSTIEHACSENETIRVTKAFGSPLRPDYR